MSGVTASWWAFDFCWLGSLVACAIWLPSSNAIFAQWGLFVASVVIHRFTPQVRPDRPQKVGPWWLLIVALVGPACVLLIANAIPEMHAHRGDGPLKDKWFMPVVISGVASYAIALRIGTRLWGSPCPGDPADPR